MLACADPLPAPPDDEAALCAERARLIELLWQVDAVRDEVVALLQEVGERIREARRQQTAPPSE